MLLDEGTYIASASTFYRVLRANHQVRERRRQASHPPRVRPELVARNPNEVWSWDKVVVSTTLGSADWANSTVIGSDARDAIDELKEKPGKNILVSGSPTLVRWLLHEGLLDELDLLIFRRTGMRPCSRSG